VAERLRNAAEEGRILAHELEERLATALRAKTYGELDVLTADLPGARGARVPQQRSRTKQLLQRQPTVTVAILVAVTLVALVLAALVLAGIVAFSGVWVFFAFFWMWRGGPRHGRRYRRYPPAGRRDYYRRNVPGRW
jgi:hypothetical protein